jgi:hypothetical protein
MRTSDGGISGGLIITATRVHNHSPGLSAVVTLFCIVETFLASSTVSHMLKSLEERMGTGV